MQTNNATNPSAAQTAATVATAVKSETAKRVREVVTPNPVEGAAPTPQQEEKPKRTRKAAAAQQQAKTEPAATDAPQQEGKAEPAATTAPQQEDKTEPAATNAPQQESKKENLAERAARMQRELQTTLQRLTRLQDLNSKRTKFIATLDLLADAKDKLSDEEDFETKTYRIDFCTGVEYRADKLFSIANRALLLDFVDFMQARIRERVTSLEAQIIEA